MPTLIFQSLITSTVNQASLLPPLPDSPTTTTVSVQPDLPTQKCSNFLPSKLLFCTPASTDDPQAAESTAAVMSECHPDLPLQSWTPNALTLWLQILKVTISPRPRCCLLPNARRLPESWRCHIKSPCKNKKEPSGTPRQLHHPGCLWSEVSQRTGHRSMGHQLPKEPAQGDPVLQDTFLCLCLHQTYQSHGCRNTNLQKGKRKKETKK